MMIVAIIHSVRRVALCISTLAFDGNSHK